jgi:hypothetical protein
MATFWFHCLRAIWCIWMLHQQRICFRPFKHLSNNLSTMINIYNHNTTQTSFVPAKFVQVLYISLHMTLPYIRLTSNGSKCKICSSKECSGVSSAFQIVFGCNKCPYWLGNTKQVSCNRWKQNTRYRYTHLERSWAKYHREKGILYLKKWQIQSGNASNNYLR